MKDLVEKILSKQNEDGSWGDPLRFYTDKYRGTIWCLLLLAELNANKDDSRVKRACEFVLNYSYDNSSGGFSTSYSTKYNGGLPSKTIPCLTGNMVYSLIKLGYLNDYRVQKSLEWIVKYQRVDDGKYSEPKPEKYKNLKACFSKHSCFMGVVKSLKALIEVPHEVRSPEVKIKIEELTEFMLMHHIYKRSHDLTQNAKPTWLRFRFPLMYQTDVLEILDMFRKLEVKDIRLKDAYEQVKSQEIDGSWISHSSFEGKTIVPFSRRGEPSPWITDKARKILTYYGGIFS